MTTRFTNWINSVVSALTGSGVASGDRIPIVDVSGTPATKYLAVSEIKNIPSASLGLLKLAAGGDAVENVGAIESNVLTVATTGSTETLDLATYGVFDLTMDQNCAFTFSNPAPSGKATVAVLIIRGAFTPSFSNTMIEPDGAALTYGAPSTWIVWTVNGGTSYFIASAGKSFA